MPQEEVVKALDMIIAVLSELSARMSGAGAGPMGAEGAQGAPLGGVPSGLPQETPNPFQE